MGFGDELMVTGHVREMQRADPRKVRLEYGKKLWNQVFDNNPRIARPGESGDHQVLHPRVNGLRPYIARKTETLWTWKSYKPHVGELYFTKDERDYAAKFSLDVVIEPWNKQNASPNKDWGRDRWQQLVRILLKRGLQPVQLGSIGTQLLEGARHVMTPNFRWAASVLSRARAAVLPEGGMHHAAAAVSTPAVVIFGGYISPRQTGYDGQVSLFTGGEPCGMRIKCAHCAAAMAKITPEDVADRVMGVLR